MAWFLAALLVFSLAYTAWRSHHPVLAEHIRPLRRSDLVKVAVFIAVASYLVRLRFPVPSGDSVLAANLWEYPQMSALFALGVLARERGWLTDGLPPQLRRTCGRAAAVGFVLAVLAGVGIAISGDPDPFLGRSRWPLTSGGTQNAWDLPIRSDWGDDERPPGQKPGEPRPTSSQQVPLRPVLSHLIPAGRATQSQRSHEKARPSRK